MNSAYSEVERPPREGQPFKSGKSWDSTGTRRAILSHLTPLKAIPTKYRRPPKVDRDSFGGGVQGISHDL